MPLSSDVQSKRCLEVRIIIKHASGKLIEIASSRHPERRQQWRIHLACLTHKLFLNIKVQYFSSYFPYYSLLDLAQAINNYASLKGFVVLCGQSSYAWLRRCTKIQQICISCLPMERIMSCLAYHPLVHAVWRHESSKQAGNRGAKLPGAPHKIFFPSIALQKRFIMHLQCRIVCAVQTQ